ncbi:hypothetical protein NPIL_682181, partial [Nephila pilipes]
AWFIAAERTDFFGLRRNASRIRSTFSSLVLGLLDTERVLMKPMCHSWMLSLDGDSLLNLIRKFR